VLSYISKFGDKISYQRNDENIHNLNYEKSLRLAHGVYRKLHNDQLKFVDNGLSIYINFIKQLLFARPVLFISGGNSYKDPVSICEDLSQFVSIASYYSTWIGGFGIWEDDLAKLSDFSRAVGSDLIQVDVLFRLLAMGKKAVVLNLPLQVTQSTGRRSGYSIPRVFGKNYLEILKQYVLNGSLSNGVYEDEKRKVLVEHILPYYFSPDHDFERGNFFFFLSDYLNEPYFYYALEPYLGRDSTSLGNQENKPVPHTPAADTKRLWRQANPHNEIYLDDPVNPSLAYTSFVKAGNFSYGPIIVHAWGHPDERLDIGNFVSISRGVTFILGGNHSHDCFSTFPFKVKFFGHELEALTKGPITIGDDVWLGTNVTVLSGVTINQGAIVAAGSVVTRDVEAYSVVGGSPARTLKFRFEASVRERLQRVDFSRIDAATVLSLGERLYEKLDANNISAFLDDLRKIS
jgi:acetyltransferase-like isoleucine patch superfamily enzyme